MTDKIILMFGGVQGEGVVSTGDTLIKVLSRIGYFSYGYRTFSSRIKGGHTNYVIDIQSHKVLSCRDTLDILIAFDQESIVLNYSKLKEGGLLIYDDIVSVKDLLDTLPSKNIHLYGAPLTAIAKKYGTSVMKNTALMGLLGQLFALPYIQLEMVLRQTFEKKGETIVSKNLSVLQESYNLERASFLSTYQLAPPQEEKSRPSMIGNEAIALGALMAGCRFMAAYPITPASEIMEYLTKKFPRYNGVMVQTEDEISAITMTLGASYGGCRSMTATSGPGISLMLEAIGLSGMAEIPVVVVDAQRGGPSTGLPTKHEQSDIDSLYYGPHGEIPSIILAPYSVEECFYQTIDAFNLADQYQCPVFLASDLNLSLSRQTIEDLNPKSISIDRGKLAHPTFEIDGEEKPFKRFLFTEDGISPRAYPGMPNGIHALTGIEHQETGRPDEGKENRKKMMDKRMRKLMALENIPGIDIFGSTEGNLLILSMGSNYGIIRDSVADSALPIAYGMVKRIKPLPVRQLENLLQRYEKVLVIENNYRGQLAGLLKKEIGYHHKVHSLLKYDGLPFTHSEVLRKIEELI
ncbi:MAG: 2-oxoacid:acceptor oxidoreductase subunit alpha [Thermotaleaceae bacterium]